MCSVLKEMLLSNPHPQQPEGFARQLAAASDFDVRDRLGELSVPTHVVGAEEDVLVPVWKSKELAKLIPGAKLTVIEGAAHGVNLERAEDFNRIVLEFLTEHVGAAAPS
jgi:3-oxoadipate enol-lactonase